MKISNRLLPPVENSLPFTAVSHDKESECEAHLDRAQVGHANFDGVVCCSVPARSCRPAAIRRHIDVPPQTVQRVPQHVRVPSAAQVAQMRLQECHLVLKGLIRGRLRKHTH